MATSNIYRMVLNGEEYVGKATDLAGIAGYNSAACIGMIARGEMHARKGLEIECIGREEPSRSQEWRNNGMILADWDRTVGMFSNVKWVGKGTANAKELVVVK